VPNGAYYKFNQPVALIENPGSVLVIGETTDPLQIDSITNSPGRYVCEHGIAVEIHLKDTENEQPQVTQSRLFRYAIAIERVLAIKNMTQEATGVSMTFRRVGQATYTAVRQATETDQAGEFTGSARIPFMARMHESL